MVIANKYKSIPQEAKKVFQGERYSLWQWEQELYDGSTATFEALKRTDTAQVVGVLSNNKIMLVDDVQPHRDAVITPAGGAVEGGEEPAKAAKREFLEETGYEAGTLMPWYNYRPSATVDSTVYAYIGRDLKKVGKQNLEPGEKIKILTYTFDEFVALGSDSNVRDLVLRIILLEAQLDNKKKAELKNILYGK
jgi:ADP-ribose pyrophosphatase